MGCVKKLTVLLMHIKGGGNVACFSGVPGFFHSFFGCFACRGRRSSSRSRRLHGFRRETEKAYPGGTVAITAPLYLDIRRGKERWSSYLFTIYSYCKRNPTSCEAAAIEQVQQLAVANMATPGAPEASALRVVVRPSAYVAQVAQTLGGKDKPIAKPIVGDLWMIAVLDHPTTISILKPRDLDALHLSAEEALARAKENTKADIARRIPGKVADSKIGVLPGDTYEASLLAFPEMWAPLAKSFDERLIVSAPGAHMMLFSKENAPDAVAALAEIAEASMHGEQRPPSSAVYRWTKDGGIEALR
jgi:hypothetical protein